MFTLNRTLFIASFKTIHSMYEDRYFSSSITHLAQDLRQRQSFPAWISWWGDLHPRWIGKSQNCHGTTSQPTPVMLIIIIIITILIIITTILIIITITIMTIIIPVTLSIGSISQEQLNDVVSPRSTMLGTDTLKLLRLSGPDSINANVININIDLSMSMSILIPSYQYDDDDISVLQPKARFNSKFIEYVQSL